MRRTERPGDVSGFRMGWCILFGVLVAIAVLTLALAGKGHAGVAAILPPPQPRAQATLPVTFTLDDFDDRIYYPSVGYDQPRSPNGFFGDQGLWNSNTAIITASSVCSATFNCYLSLAYSLSLSVTSTGGYFEMFSSTYVLTTPTWPLRDLREFEQFRFRVRSDQAGDFPDPLYIEFVGGDFGNWVPLASYRITGVADSWQWKTLVLTDTVDWSRVRHVAVKLTGAEMTQRKGRLYFDDMVLVDQNFSGDWLDLVQRQAFRYFWENRHPQTGFVRDRAVYRDVTSVAAVSFELAAFGIGAEHGWVSRAEAAAATQQVLSTLLALPQGPAPTGTAGYKGLFYHMLDIGSGLRAPSSKPNSEVSTIDTALLMAGVLFARQYYTGTDPTEIAIRDLADALYNRAEWDWVLRTEPQPGDKANHLYLAWKPEFHDCEQSQYYTDCYEIPDTRSGNGYFSGMITVTEPITRPMTWDYYTDEILFLNLLAMGSPTHSVPADTFYVWTRELGTYEGYTFYQSWDGQLFQYLIGQVWLDVRGVREKEPAHVDWWRNSGQAALANRQFAIDHAITCTSYSTLSWGLSTCLGPPDDPTISTTEGIGVYRGYGALPRGNPAPPLQDCTVAPYAAAGSIAFLSRNPAENEAYRALEHWFRNQPRLWGLYGFTDGFNLNRGWFAHDYVGIDQGMTLLAIENYRTGLVWGALRRDPALARAIAAVLESSVYLPVLFRNGD